MDSTPEAFVCPLCRRLMEDPVVLPTGISFDRRCISSCVNLGLLPPTTTFTDNSNLLAAIHHYRHSLLDGSEPPNSPSSSNPNQLHPPNRPLPTSSDSDRRLDPLRKYEVSNNQPISPNPFFFSEEDCLRKLRSPEVSEQGEGLRLLHDETRENSAQRIRLCTGRLLSALLPHLDSSDAAMQSDATASVANLSLEKPNKTTVLHAGAVPRLVTALRCPNHDVRSHAAAALFALSLEASSRTPIGFLGAVQPLVWLLVNADEPMETRLSAAMALHHLCSTCESNANRVAREEGAVATLLAISVESENGGLAKATLAVVLSLGRWPEGREALVDKGAVEEVVGVLRWAKGGIVELCVKVLYVLHKTGRRFWVEAERVGLKKLLEEEVWAREKEKGMEKAAEIARKLLVAMEVAGEIGDERRERVRSSPPRPPERPIVAGGGRRLGMRSKSFSDLRRWFSKFHNVRNLYRRISLRRALSGV